MCEIITKRYHENVKKHRASNLGLHIKSINPLRDNVCVSTYMVYTLLQLYNIGMISYHLVYNGTIMLRS